MSNPPEAVTKFLSGHRIVVAGVSRSSVGNIPVGSTRRVLVDPTGASHVEISQRNAEGRGRVLVPCYFEAGFSGALEIDLRCDSALVVGNSISVGYW